MWFQGQTLLPSVNRQTGVKTLPSRKFGNNQLHFVAGRSTSHVALRWLLQTPPVSSAIVGAASVEQLEEAAGATGWKLTQHEVSII